jgi:hypothetical protein
MNSEQLKKFAEDLKNARETSNLTLLTMHQRTRIDIKFLQAIEDGNFEIIDEVYIRAFVRAYAKTVGLNETEVLKKFDLAKSGRLFDSESEELKPDKVTKPDVEKKKVVFTSENLASPYNESKSTGKIDPRLYFLGALIIVIALAAYFFFLSGNSSKIIVETAKQTNLAETPKVERFDIIESDTASVLRTPITDSLSLNIAALSKSWIRIKTDNNSPFEFTLLANESKILEADSLFNLLVGNAGGIKIELNGNPLELLGKIGEIKNIRIDASGIKYLKIEQKNED